MSGSVPAIKLKSILAEPDALLLEAMYCKPSKPVIFCSMICVTESSTIFADAPGYEALIEIVGGAMSGYCAIGKLGIAKLPASMITIAITHAKIGRSMKNSAMY